MNTHRLIDTVAFVIAFVIGITAVSAANNETKRGVLFTNADCVSPNCGPSQTSVLTGMRPETTGVFHNRVFHNRVFHNRVFHNRGDHNCGKHIGCVPAAEELGNIAARPENEDIKRQLAHRFSKTKG